MLQGALSLLADHWPWFALAYLACCACALALCHSAKLADEACERAGVGGPAWRAGARPLLPPSKPPVALLPAVTPR
jgi:hypothetical protein